MFSKLLDLVKEAITRMFTRTGKYLVESSDITNVISDKMKKRIELWVQMYEDESPWLGGEEDVASLGIAPMVCSELARAVTIEMESKILDKEHIDDLEEHEEPKTRAQYLNKVYQEKLVSVIRAKLEYAMATGGMVIKPYVSNERLYFDYLAQGEFVPLAFDDDGNIIDIAFPDSFISNGKKYTKIERHIFSQAERTITITNRAFVSTDPENDSDLGKEIPLSQVEIWSHLSEEPVTITDVEKPLYGFYKVPKANNVDEKCPLGVSVFSRAVRVIKKADFQFTRLDWEYEAGQMAVDADPTVIDTGNQSTKYRPQLPQGRKRMFRGIDVDDMYSVFAPALRDASYREGLNSYLIRIEDLCELSRGTFSDPNQDARTAEEIIVMKQRAYSNVLDNQQSLENCLKDVVYAMNVYCDLYGLFQDGEYTMSNSWDDSIIADRKTEMEEKIELVNIDVLGKDELRSWYTGESLEKAQEMIDAIQEAKPDLMNDLFSMNESNEEIEGSAGDEE